MINSNISETINIIVQEHSFPKMKSYVKPLFKAYLEFLNDHFKSKINVKLNIRKSKSISFGNVVLRKTKPKIYVINVSDVMYSLQLAYIAHEFTHAVQIDQDRLTICFDNICFDGQEYSGYSNANTNEQKAFPFEVEAYHNQKTLPKLFTNSHYIKDILGINPTLDMIIDSIQ